LYVPILDDRPSERDAPRSAVLGAETAEGLAGLALEIRSIMLVESGEQPMGLPLIDHPGLLLCLAGESTDGRVMAKCRATL